MKERPILFSAPMVRAILAGTKTQTRRVVKFNIAGNAALGGKSWHIDDPNAVLACPYGQPGDRLWVRESFSGVHDYDVGHDGKPWPPSAWFQDEPIWYWADGNPDHGDWTRPRPSIHMPRWASRITLELTDVRVQRLQDISEAESRAEGIIQYEDEIGYGTGYPDTDPNLAGTGVGAFRKLWESINGADAWDANPWVWVISFQQVQP